MSIPSPHRACSSHIPEEDEFIAPNRGERGIVGGDGEVEDLIAVAASVFLDERSLCGVEEANGAVGAAGEEVLSGAGGVGQGVNLSW
jgi:hypothetical protein